MSKNWLDVRVPFEHVRRQTLLQLQPHVLRSLSLHELPPMIRTKSEKKIQKNSKSFSVFSDGNKRIFTAAAASLRFCCSAIHEANVASSYKSPHTHITIRFFGNQAKFLPLHAVVAPLFDCVRDVPIVLVRVALKRRRHVRRRPMHVPAIENWTEF